MNQPVSIKKRWVAACQAFDARPVRERALLALGGVALVFWLGDSLALSPATKRWKAAQLQAQQAQTQLDAVRQAQVLAQIQADQQRQQGEREFKTLQAELARLEGRPGALEAGRMLTLLEELVGRHSGEVRLVALASRPDTSVPPAPVASAASGAGEHTGAPRLYRHGIELVLRGRYEALHRYVRDVALSESRLRVRQLSLVVREHPELELTVLVETLSPQAAWLTL